MFRPEFVRLLLPPVLFTIALANPFKPGKTTDQDHPPATVAAAAPVARPVVDACESVADEDTSETDLRGLARRLRNTPDVEDQTVTEGLAAGAADPTPDIAAPCTR